MTTIANVIDGRYGLLGGLSGEADTVHTGPITILGKLIEWGKTLFSGLGQYDTSLENDFGSFKYIGIHKGKPVYSGSNEAIGRLLDRYGKGRGSINYGAAFENNIYVIDQLVESVADGGSIDPLSHLKLKYVLDHELAHLEGADESGANRHAQNTTGLTIAQLGGFI